LAGTTPLLGASLDCCGPTRSQGRSPHDEAWRRNAGSRRRPAFDVGWSYRFPTRALKLQCGHSSVLQIMKEAWWLNHDSNDSSLRQESLVQVTASPRWTTTVPRHSGNGIACIVPPLDMSHRPGGAAPNGAGIDSLVQSNRHSRRPPLAPSEYSRPPATREQQQNRLAYFLRDAARSNACLANTITSHVGDGMCNVCRLRYRRKPR
jgi:hypothetical protein